LASFRNRRSALGRTFPKIVEHSRTFPSARRGFELGLFSHAFHHNAVGFALRAARYSVFKEHPPTATIARKMRFVGGKVRIFTVVMN